MVSWYPIPNICYPSMVMYVCCLCFYCFICIYIYMLCYRIISSFLHVWYITHFLICLIFFLVHWFYHQCFLNKTFQNRAFKRLEYFKINQKCQSHGWYGFAREWSRKIVWCLFHSASFTLTLSNVSNPWLKLVAIKSVDIYWIPPTQNQPLYICGFWDSLPN